MPDQSGRVSSPAVVGGCACGHPMVEHYANGCGWCLCKVSGPAKDEAEGRTPSFAGRLRHSGRVHMLWWHYTDKTSLPLSVWRPLCWFVARGHAEHYGACVRCGKAMTEPARTPS